MEKQPFVRIQSNQIAYFKKNANNSRCIVFIHGHSSSSHVWRKQWSDELFKDFCLLSIDLPGNGDSGAGASPETDYGPKGSAALLVETVKQLVKDLPYILVGFSFGNNIIAEMLALGLRPYGLALLSPCIVGKGFELDHIILQKEGNVYLMEDPADALIIAFLSKELTSQDPQDQKNYFDDFKRVAPDYRKWLLTSIGNGKYSDEVEIIKQANVTTLVAFGSKDTLFNINYLNHAALPLWHEQVLILEGAAHFLPTDNFQQVNKILHQFASDVLKQGF